MSAPSSAESPYIVDGLSDGEVVQWLDDQPSYNGILKVFRGDFSPESMTRALGGSTEYRIIDGAEGPYSAIQGTGGGNGGTADRSKRSDPFNYHTDGFFFDTPPPMFSLVCENPGI